MDKDSKKETFLLIDGSAIVHRAYHALPHFSSSNGQSTGAVHGFFAMLFKVMQELNPTRVAIAFDRPKPTFRQQLYVGYQAQRPKMESELSDQFKMILEILEKAHIATYAVDGYEADDIIGIISEEAKSPKLKDKSRVIILTGDRDMFQLIDENTNVLIPIKGISEVILMDAEKVREKYGIKPPQVVELKALMGDASDNYPGVPGVGPKTASNLINDYETIDNIAAKNQKLAQKLIDGHDSCRVSHQLAKIVRDVPFVFDFSDCETKNIQVHDLQDTLTARGFKSLPARVDAVFGENGIFKQENKGQMKLL